MRANLGVLNNTGSGQVSGDEDIKLQGQALAKPLSRCYRPQPPFNSGYKCLNARTQDEF